MKAIIFDYDGLLVDTEDIWFQSCKQLCATYSVDITEAHRQELMRSGLSDYLVQRFSLPDSSDVIRPKLYGTFYALSAEGIKMLPGAKSALEKLKKRYTLAVGTGSNTSQVQTALTDLQLIHYFQITVGSDQVQHGKPAPDIYLKVAQDLGVSPSECLVFEDQPKGLQAAKSAGMKCIVVPNQYLPDADYSLADAVIRSLEEVTPDFIEYMRDIV